MNMKEYQQKAARTINNNIDNAELIESCTLGMAQEVGKLASIVNSDRFKGFDCIEERKGEIASIIGDVLWYASTAATSLDIPLEDIAINNIYKLEKKYPYIK